MWFLSWDAYTLSRLTLTLSSDFLHHPDGINLMWNPTRMTQGLLVAPINLTLGPVLAYNASQVMAIALTAWAAYLALVALVRSRLGAFAGGLLYGFSPYMLGHAPVHSDYIFMPIPPLVLLLFHHLASNRTASPIRWGAALGLLGVAQFFTTEEVAATMALMAAVGVILVLLARSASRETLRRCAKAVAVALAVAGLLLAVPVAYQFFGPQSLHGEFHGFGLYETDLLGYVIPTSTLAAYPSALTHLGDHLGGGPTEQTAYLGLPLIALLVYTVWRWRTERLVSWSAIMLVIAALFSMGSILQVAGHLFLFPLPWLVFQFLPLYGSALTARLMLYAYLMSAVLLAVFIARLPAHPPRPRVAGYLLLLLVAASLLPRAPLAAYPRTVPAFFTGPGVAQVAGETVLVAPFSADPGLLKNPPEAIDPMLWQAASGMRFKMPDGYAWGPGPDGRPLAGPPPTRTQDLMTGISRSGGYPTLCRADREQVFTDLRRWEVGAVVVGPMGQRAKMVQFFTDLLGSPPREVGGVSLWTSIPANTPEGDC